MTRDRKPVGQPIGCGVDVIELSRFRKTLKRWGQPFLRRVYTEEELRRAKQRRDAIGFLAGRFAAKEAVVKAMSQVDPNHPLTMQQIEIRNDALGRPFVLVNHRAIRHPRVYVSLSHSTTTAVASAIATP